HLHEIASLLKWRITMSASTGPVDPKTAPESVDTSEQLEQNQGAEFSEDTHSAPRNWEQLLSESEAKVAQYHEELLRARAEVENVRRRAQEEVAKARKFGTESFAESLIPVKDSMEAALAIADQTAESWKEGAEATLRQLNNAF